jgi:hypothetical protein
MRSLADPRRRERGTTRLAKVSPRRNRGSACGGGYGRKGSSRRLAAICGRSDHQIDGDIVNPPFQRCPTITVGSRLEPPWWTAAGYSRQSRHQDNSFAAAGRLRRPMIHRAIVMMHSVYEIRVTLSTKKIDAFGSGGLAAASTICGQARQPRAPHRCFIPPPIPFPGHGGIRGIEIDGVLEIARL